MPILEKLKSYLSLFQNIQKEDEPEDYATRFERLHRNGRSDEKWEARNMSIQVCLASLVLIMWAGLMKKAGFLRFWVEMVYLMRNGKLKKGASGFIQRT